MKGGKIPNVGKVLSAKLDEAGIHTIEELKEKGAEKTFIKIREKDPGACLDMLYALEGAIQHIRWHNLPAERKNELKAWFNKLKTYFFFSP